MLLISLVYSFWLLFCIWHVVYSQKSYYDWYGVSTEDKISDESIYHLSRILEEIVIGLRFLSKNYQLSIFSQNDISLIQRLGTKWKHWFRDTADKTCCHKKSVLVLLLFKSHFHNVFQVATLGAIATSTFHLHPSLASWVCIPRIWAKGLNSSLQIVILKFSSKID